MTVLRQAQDDREVIIRREGAAGFLTLNRPKAIHALTQAMDHAMTEALLALQVVPPGVYVAMHNRTLRFPGVVKDRSRMTFVMASELARDPHSGS